MKGTEMLRGLRLLYVIVFSFGIAFFLALVNVSALSLFFAYFFHINIGYILGINLILWPVLGGVYFGVKQFLRAEGNKPEE
jgi:hypothetical protein